MPRFSKPKIDTMLSGLADAADRARQLESLGVDGVFTFEGPHDVFTPLVLAAPATTTLDLMTNVAIAFPRNPIQLAHQAYDLQLLSHGRFILGLGTQVRAQVEKRYGAGFDRPVSPPARARRRPARHRRELAARRPPRLPGRLLSAHPDDAHVQPWPNPHGPVPIYLGALGPQMTRLAAEVADGLLVMPFNCRSTSPSEPSSTSRRASPEQAPSARRTT